MDTAVATERTAPRPFRIAMIGCNHRTAPVELRERVAFSPEQALRAADELRLRDILDEAVVLSTCNRSELYGVSSEATVESTEAMERFFGSFHQIGAAELSGRIYRQTGAEAVQHLFRVAAGLDSMLLGEAEILGQVRDAYSRALEHGSTGPVLNRLFQAALEVGKRVRSETEVSARPMSVAFAGVKLAERVFGKLTGHQALIVGAGTVADQVAEHLRNRGIRGLQVVNRSRERAEALARRIGGEAVDWACLESAMEHADFIVTSVGEAGVVLTRTMLERAVEARSGRAIFLVDLGVPRNIASEAVHLYNVYLYNVDDLGEIVEDNRKAREAEIPRAEAIIANHVAKFRVWMSGVEAVSFFDQLRERLHAQRQAFLHERLETMSQISPEERQRFARLTEELLERMLEAPGERLRRTRDLKRRVASIEVLRHLFGLDEGDS